MLMELFTWLSRALSSAPYIALFGSFVWGILSIILSPCHLASIPLIVGFINGQGKISVKRAFSISLLFSTGILITIGIIGLLTGLAGRMLGDIGVYGNYLVAAVFFVVGLYLLDIVPLAFLSSGINQPVYEKKGLLAAFILGLIFGVALGPCTFAYMAPMLGIAFSVAATNLIFAVALIFAYALGHISVIVFAGTFSEIVQGFLNWNERSKGISIVKKICGVLVILGGIYLIIK
jgi:cytochrome c-type biogenesis protein